VIETTNPPTTNGKICMMNGKIGLTKENENYRLQEVKENLQKQQKRATFILSNCA
jgi:cytochrome c-type biogenesis protein CcmE